MAMNHYTLDLNPWIFQFGQWGLTWYWFFYWLGLGIVCLYLFWNRKNNPRLHSQQWVDLMIVLWLCVLIGGRLGFAFFYQPITFLRDPSLILKIWLGGMSFHGALLASVLGLYWFSRKNNLNFWKLADHLVIPIPLALFLGRIGNFINGELWGRPSDLPWAMIFPRADQIPRHPSPLYEALGEGLLLFCLLLLMKSFSKKTGTLSLAFLLFYSGIRFGLEFFREPDLNIGYLAGYFTLGQIYCFLTILLVLASVKIRAGES